MSALLSIHDESSLSSTVDSLIHRKCIETGSLYLPTKQTSMCSFIIWNISKALEKNPRLDLRHAMHSAHERLERESREGSGMISQPPDRRYLTCALLAWQQLGYNDADSLYQFVEENRGKLVGKDPINLEKITTNKAEASTKLIEYVASHEKKVSKDSDLSSIDTVSLMGPVVKLPVETKIVMHVENSHDCSHHNAKKTQKLTPAPVPKPQNNTMKKIDAACCLDTACLQRLTELDTAVNELRSRAAKLARRESERVELLERAEAAWKDLELGYQRRLNLAQEKEDDITGQIKSTIEERNNYKNACTSLVETLKEHGEIAEKERGRLMTVEKEVCERAHTRLQLSEESARHDAALAEQLCRTTQLDRDLLFKEEQAQRRVWSIQNNIESARCLTHEAERAMRAELAALKDQIKQVSERLFVEKTENKNIKSELEELRQEKADIIEDLDGCKLTCDNRMQAIIEELKQKRALVKELNEKVIECKCKLPQDIAVEVKRTPSVAALCQCSPEDKLLDSCSCTSLRSQLLSNLLADLFGGLQSELSGSGLIMPCQLLKCLEDKHNWDRSSAIKTNLLNFFAQLLVGELDIAIATSIENYHAKWVGKSCADQVRTIPDYDETDENWQERAIEHRAQKLASKLAEQLYNERAEQLTKKAKDIVSKGPPPCQCKNQPAAFPCIVKTPHSISNTRKTNDIAPSYFKRTMQDVTQLRLQIEDLKKDSVKKEDFWHMEDKITKIVQRAAKSYNLTSTSRNNKCNRDVDKQKDKESDYDKFYESENAMKKTNSQKESFCSNRQFHYMGRNPGKIFKKKEQSFAVNLCLCDTAKKSNKLPNNYGKKSLKAWKAKKTGDLSKNIAIEKESKPINCLTYNRYNMSPVNKYPSHTLCPSEYACFHKLPSNTSIDNLLNYLLKWKKDIMKYSKDYTKEQDSDYNKKLLHSTNPNNDLITNDVKVNNSKSTKNTDQFPMYSVTCSSSNKMRDKSTDYINTLPPTTESEYIGEMDLDKSNDNICKCKVKQYINNINRGDSNDISSDDLYTCHNTDICGCVKMPDTSKQNIPENEKSVLQNESQIYPVELQKSQLQGFEYKENKGGVHDSFICDVGKKSQIFSSGDYNVKFLGVTLTNTNELFSTKNSNKHYVIRNENYYTKFPVESYYSAPSQCNVNVYNDGELLQNMKMDHLDQNELVNMSSDVKKYEESKCICCNKDNTMADLSNDLEVNAFNLLEEHLTGKLDELQTELTCISHQEKRELFTSILKKVKQVISESTNPLSCSCAGLCGDEKRWSRAYGLLLEYLKVKIKRVQCSCDSNDENENPVLPKVLEKICKLIENDFQRLKEKYKQNNLKKTYLDHQTSPIHQAFTEMHVQVQDSDGYIKRAKSIGDISCQVSSYVPVDDKSCEVINNLETLNTAEKNVSCEMRNVNGKDCVCRNLINMSNHFEKEIFVNVCTEPVSSNATMTVISKNITDDLSKIPKLKSSMSLKKSVEFKSNCDEIKPEYPYFGYTLNCSCDPALGNCHCIKSMINTNYEKVDLMLKPLPNERFPKKMSYIMSKALNKVKSEPIYTNELNNNSGSNNLKQDIMKYNKESSTYTYQNIVLKKSYECGIMYDKASTIDNNSIDDNINSEYCSHWHDRSEKQLNKKESYATDTEYDKYMLYDSLYLPTDKCIKYKNSMCSDTNLETASENCDCIMVPVCHVKMLVEDIEKKIIESTCTCDALASRICPVHSVLI